MNAEAIICIAVLSIMIILLIILIAKAYKISNAEERGSMQRGAIVITGAVLTLAFLLYFK